MPPIKRTKFKLSPEQLLEMFQWLKLIRAFDDRFRRIADLDLSHRANVLTGRLGGRMGGL